MAGGSIVDLVRSAVDTLHVDVLQPLQLALANRLHMAVTEQHIAVAGVAVPGRKIAAAPRR